MVEPAEIRTDRLVMRRLRTADTDAFVALHSAPEAPPHDGWSRRTPEQALELLDWFLDDWSTDGIGYWTIRLADTGEVIGFGGVRHAWEVGEHVLNLAYRLWPSAWGNGYALEMAREALRWAHQHRPERPVVIVTDTGNAPSARVAEKLGFTLHLERHRDGRPELVFRST